MRWVYRAARRGEFKTALRLTLPTLLEDEDHYEALLLKAKLHRRLGEARRSRWTLQHGLRNSRFTDGQQAVFEYLIRHLDDPSRSCWKF